VTGEASTIATSPVVSVAVIAQFAAQPARPVVDGGFWAGALAKCIKMQ
jgi:hypothetical protein